MKTAKTQEEADDILDKYKVTEVLPFCPLIKDQCNRQCVCYIPAYMRPVPKDNPTTFYIYQGDCSNAMFTETEITVNM